MVGKVDDGRNLGVVDDLGIASRIDDLGRGQANIHDGASEIINHDDVADMEFVLEDDIKPAMISLMSDWAPRPMMKAMMPALMRSEVLSTPQTAMTTRTVTMRAAYLKKEEKSLMMVLPRRDPRSKCGQDEAEDLAHADDEAEVIDRAQRSAAKCLASRPRATAISGSNHRAPPRGKDKRAGRRR
jgi:hypothetical protein